MRITLSLAALAATLVTASPAFAQTIPPVTATAEADAKGVVLLPLTLISSQDLDFGTIIANQNTGGTVVIDPENGARSVTAPLIEVPGPYTRALFQGVGYANTDVTLTFTSAVVLQTNGGSDSIAGTLALDQNGSLTRTADSNGAFGVAVGGSFAIKAKQTPGVYTATFDLTAQYQ